MRARRVWLSGLALGTVCASAMGSEPLAEQALVERYLAGPIGEADRASVAANSRVGTALPQRENPALTARHESPGGGGATDALGVSVRVDLGLSGASDVLASARHRQAAEHLVAAGVLNGVCALRRDALDLWASSGVALASTQAQERLDQAVRVLTGRAEAGEVSAHSRDLVALSAQAHRVGWSRALGAVDQLRGRVSALVDQPVSEVELADLGVLAEREAVGVQAHPELSALRLLQQAEQAREAARRRDALPDLEVSLGPRWDRPAGGTGAAGFELGGALEIPLFDWSRERVRTQSAVRAEVQAALLRRQGTLQAQADAAWLRASRLEGQQPGPDPEQVWQGAWDRYTQGEASVEELMQTAQTVEAGAIAAVQLQRERRLAHLDLACASGDLGPDWQPLLETSR